MDVETLFRYPFVRPAAEAAGSCCKARLRGFDQEIPDYLRKLHKPRAPGSEARLRGFDQEIPDYLLKKPLSDS